jgi:hypothetical protein
MEVYQASHGGVAQLERHLSEYTSYVGSPLPPGPISNAHVTLRLETLCHDAAEAADVPMENMLIFLEDGREVRDDIIQEMWEKGEQDGQQVGPLPTKPDESRLNQRQTLYLFNRQTFFTDPEEWAAQFQEEISLPPPLNRESDPPMRTGITAYDVLSCQSRRSRTCPRRNNLSL